MKQTKQISVGGVLIGGGAPVTVQSMTNTPTDDVDATLAQIRSLAEAGCEIVRCAVPDMAAAHAIGRIKAVSPLPVVADIHFDYKLALEAVAAGADKIRINPGNIGSRDRVRAVADACRLRGVPIRVGVNSGSIEKPILEKYGRSPHALVESAMSHVRLLESVDFSDICISIKSSDVGETVAAYRELSALTDYPLHIGVTEAGTAYNGLVRSAVGLGALLLEGIGDTLRISLTADPVEEVRAGIAILKAAGLRREGVHVVSCPTCGRTRIDLIPLAQQVETALAGLTRDITVAVMGCVVNGPGEAREADYGIAGGDGEGVLFKKGQVVGRVPGDRLCQALLDLIHQDE